MLKPGAVASRNVMYLNTSIARKHSHLVHAWQSLWVLLELLGKGQRAQTCARVCFTLYSVVLGVLSKHGWGCSKEPSKDTENSSSMIEVCEWDGLSPHCRGGRLMGSHLSQRRRRQPWYVSVYFAKLASLPHCFKYYAEIPETSVEYTTSVTYDT